jgi:hypothetical protein
MAGGAKLPARSYWCSAHETDAIVSRMDNSVNIHSPTTSSISSSLLGSSGASGSTIPTLGKSIYQPVASSIASSTVMVPTTEEVSATPAAGEGSGTSAAGEGSDAFAAGEGSGTEVITTSCPLTSGVTPGIF